MELAWWKRLAVVLPLYAFFWWYHNPIRLHKMVRLGGVTANVPFGWIVDEVASPAQAVDSVNLRRAISPVPFVERPYVTASLSTLTPGGQPFTIDSARRAQSSTVRSYADGHYYSGPRTFEVSSGKYPAYCAEATLRAARPPQVLDCFVAGTRLTIRFMSPTPVDGYAESMIASLN
jgi:hypothetical protein